MNNIIIYHNYKLKYYVRKKIVLIFYNCFVGVYLDNFKDILRNKKPVGFIIYLFIIIYYNELLIL